MYVSHAVIAGHHKTYTSNATKRGSPDELAMQKKVEILRLFASVYVASCYQSVVVVAQIVHGDVMFDVEQIGVRYKFGRNSIRYSNVTYSLFMLRMELVPFAVVPSFLNSSS